MSETVIVLCDLDDPDDAGALALAVAGCAFALGGWVTHIDPPDADGCVTLRVALLTDARASTLLYLADVLAQAAGGGATGRFTPGGTGDGAGA